MQFSTDKEKKIIIVAALAIVIIFLYSLSLNITGFVTADSFEKQLTDTQKELTEAQVTLQSAQETLTLCESNLSSLNPQLAECSLDLLATDEAVKECQAVSASCESNLTSAKSLYENALGNYKSLAASSAASICCTFRDFQSALVREWKIDDNKIICDAGNLTVNCRTGETSI